MAGQNRLLDIVFAIYFITHIPITIFIDSQAVLPSCFFPQPIQDLVSWYTREFRDPMMVDTPPWFKSFVLCELTMQFPFFFVASYAFLKGNCKWIRIPAIVYSTHVATTLIAIMYHIFVHDFSLGKYPGPSNMKEKLTLSAIYFPYLLVPVMILLRMLFSSEYSVTQKEKKV